MNLLYVPTLALFAVSTVYPLLSGVRLSFTNVVRGLVGAEKG
ncbi:hypothetical protein ACPEEZ_14580 [Frigoribacterium sp. 2-23]